MAEGRRFVRHSDHLAIVGAMAAAVLAAVVVATLYLGRDIFVPLSLAVLLSFVLAPVVRGLQRLGAPRAAAVIGVVALAFAGLFALGSLIGQQVADLAGDLPRYEATIRDKVRTLRGASAGNQTLERAADMLQDLGKELQRPNAEPPKSIPASSTASEKPIPVIVSSPPPGPLENVISLIAPLVHPLATTGLIIVFIVFILIQREDLRNRVVRLAGTADIQRTTAALDDAGGRLSRLFLTQLAINSTFGLIVGIGLWAIGVPSPALWGICAAVLRFVPYIGSIIAAAFPMALAAAVDPGWSMALWTGALFLIAEPIVGHIVEPIFLGHSAGLSPVAVVLSATFWTMLWGPIGLVLATPLTVCLVVLGRHVERLSFLDVLLGDQPALQPWELFYQRMLAGDASEAVDQAEQLLQERRLVDYYDAIVLRGLILAQNDLAAGTLDVDRAERIRDTVAELVSDLEEIGDGEPTRGEAILEPEAEAAVVATSIDGSAPELPLVDPAALSGNWCSEEPVLCIGGRSPLDEAAARVLADLIAKHGLRAGARGVEALTSANIFRLDLAHVALVCLSCLDTSNRSHIRNMVRRLRRKAAHVKIVVALWGADGSEADNTLAHCRADTASTSFRKCAAAIVGIATSAAAQTDTNENVIADVG